MKLNKVSTFKDSPLMPTKKEMEEANWEFPDKPINGNSKEIKIPIKITKIKQPIQITKRIDVQVEEVEKKEVILTTEQKLWDGTLLPTSSLDNLSYPFEFLNPPQSEFYVNRYLDANFIIQAATSAGKTVIAELARNGKFLYLSPLKAISQEKWDDWSNEKHAWSKLKVSISTGDYMLTPDRVKEMRQANVIVMTSEMLDSRSRNMRSERNDWLKDIKTLVIDEFHLLGYEGRGDKLESAVIRFTEQNPNCRIVCLSATMPNVEQIAEWLTKLNGKKTVIVKSDYRPVTLHRHYVPYFQSRDYRETESIKITETVRVVKSNPDAKFILFVHTKNAGRFLLSVLREQGMKAEFHNADLDKTERIRLQHEFNSKDKFSLRILIATSTLAWGVNTPADSVVVIGLHRGINLVSNQDVHQMCGRAGRVGKTTKAEGHAYVLIPNKDFDSYVKWCDTIQDIRSRMNLRYEGGEDVLCFHIIAEIMGGYVTNKETLIKWYERTLARFQGVELTLDDAQLILNKLEEIKMVKKNEAEIYYATGLGKVPAYLYYSPFDIYSWYRNFLHLVINKVPFNAVTLGWALGHTDSCNIDYLPQHQADEARYWVRKAEKWNLPDVRNAAPFCATYTYLLSTIEEFPACLTPTKRQLQMDFDRVSQALQMIDSLYSRWSLKELWNQLSYQIRYGIGEELVDLVKLPSIGAKRAKSLYDNGIHNRKEFVEHSGLARGILGEELYGKVVKNMEPLKDDALF